MGETERLFPRQRITEARLNPSLFDAFTIASQRLRSMGQYEFDPEEMTCFEKLLRD